MEQYIEIITINLIPGGMKSACHAKQYDKGRVIRANLVNGLTPYSIKSGDVFTLNVKKPDGNIVTVEVEATEGNTYIDFSTTEQMCAVAGKNNCEFSIENGSDLIGTANFLMIVEDSPLEGGIESQSEINNLNRQIDDHIDEVLPDVVAELVPSAVETVATPIVEQIAPQIVENVVPTVIGDNYYNKTQTDEKVDGLNVYIKEGGNVGVGKDTIKNTTGANNTALGVSALQNVSTGTYNVGVGRNSGNVVKTGSNNTLVGYGANTNTDSNTTATAVGKTSTAGEHATAVGANSGATGGYSVALGDSAKAEASNGIAIGRKTKANYAGSVALGTDNLGNGAEATAQNMIALGTSRHIISVPGRFDSTQPNTAIGDELAPDISTWSGSGATWNGSYWSLSAGDSISTSITLEADSDYLIALTVSNAITPNAEIKPMTISLGGANITIFGANDANWNVALSSSASGTTTLTLGGATWSGRISNVSVKKITAYEIPYIKVGYRSLHASGTNVVFGTGQAKITNANNGNTAIGYDAQRDINTGLQNVAVGINSQRAIQNGSYNVGIGSQAQRDITTGMYNTAIGIRAQQLLTSGCWNVAVGNETMRACTTGTNNVAIGRRAIDALEDGQFNTVTGAQAGFLRDGVSDTVKSVHSNEQAFYGFQATQYGSGQQDKACAFGSHACANENGLALGSYAQARGNGSVAIGMDSNGDSAVAENADDFVLGTSAHRFIFGDKVIKFNIDGTVTWEQLS